MQYNNEFQKIDTEAKAYFLGLMFADGCISNKVKNYQKCIRLSITDSQLIDDLYEYFPFFHKEEFDFSKYNKNSQVQYGLRKTSVKMFEDLVSNGLFERKSYENKIYLRIPNIDMSLKHHFIRGFFDGDGSINISTKRPNGRRIEFCSVSRELIQEIYDYLKDNGIEFYNIREKSNPAQKLYTMEACKTEIVLKFYNFLYKDANVYLKRKFDKFQNLRLVDRKENNPKCPTCGDRCLKGTARKNKNSISHRYKCKSCNKMFSISAQLKLDELLEKP